MATTLSLRDIISNNTITSSVTNNTLSCTVNINGIFSSNNDTVTVVLVFDKDNVPHDRFLITSYSPSITSFNVGGRNPGEERVRTVFDIGVYDEGTQSFITNQNSAHNQVVAESGSPIPISVNNSNTNALVSSSTQYPAYMITMTSVKENGTTVNSGVGCDVSISGFGLNIDYAPDTRTVSIKAVNTMPGDHISIDDSQAVSVGTSYTFEIGSFWQAEAISHDYRKIIQVDIKIVDTGTVYSFKTPEELSEIGMNEPGWGIGILYGNWTNVDLMKLFVNYEITIYFDKYVTAKISTDSSNSNDLVRLYNGDETLSLGTEFRTGVDNYVIIFKAKAGKGRRICGVTDKFNGTVTNYDWTGSCNEDFTEYRLSYGCWDETKGVVRDITIHFEDIPGAYNVYVGQTKAVKIFVGTQEILNIL